MGDKDGVAEAPTLAAPAARAAADALGATLTIAGREATAPTAPMPVVGVGRYQRGRQLGKGGMGRVVEAVDAQFNRVVAIKELLDPGNPDHRQRFLTEAMITGNLEHPGIPAVHERGVDAGAPFYAMRRVVGETLKKRLEAAPTLSERLALLPAVIRVAEALGYAHERGVVHRDVKPDNVVVGQNGDVVLLDWGLARVRGLGAEARGDGSLAGGASASSTVHGSIVGTPIYMAPEQAEGDNDRVDERTDVFALGAVLYHVLTGRAPYAGPGVEAVLAAAREARPPAVGLTEKDAPPGLVAICSKAMARDPAARYRNAAEMAKALERAQAEALLAAPTSVSRVIAFVTLILVAVTAYGFTQLAQLLPGIREMGPGSIWVAGWSALGVVLTGIEWRTAGRHRLSGIALGCAGLALLSGMVNTGLGLLMVLKGLAEPEVVADAQAYRALFVEGAFEALGSFILGAMLASFQLLVWVVVRRRVAT